MSDTATARADHLGASRASVPPAPVTRITLYGCETDEAALVRELAPRVGVHPTILEEPVCEANAARAMGTRCVSVGHKSRVSNPAILALRRAGVRYLSTRSIGDDHIDVRYAARVGITVGNVAYSPDSVADYTLMLMLMLLRDARSVLRRAEMHDYRLSEARGRELRDLTVGVIGTGRIGGAVIDRLRGFGCRILAHDSRAKTSAEHVRLDALLRESDIVTLHTPLSADTHHLLDAKRLERMKPGAVVVNTGRGALLGTEALLLALESGRLGGAALDVVEGEEGVFYTDHRGRTVENETLLRLQRLPNVIVSPHTAYYTDHALRDAIANSLLNCVTFEREDQHG